MQTRSALAWVALVLLAAFLRIHSLPVEAIDGDELFSRRAVTASWEEGYQAVRTDIVHPPLYYLVLKACVGIAGAGVTALRLVSLLAAILAISAVFAIGLVVPYLRGPALLASLLIALNDLHIFYSQQARSYSLYCALIALFVLWAFLLDEYQSRPAFWIAGALLMIAIVHTHYFGVLFIACVLIPVWRSKLPRPSNMAVLMAAAATAVASIPWLVVLIGAIREKGTVDNVNWEPLPDFYALRASIGKMFGIPDIPRGTSLVLLLGLTLAIIGILSARRHVPGRLLAMLGLLAAGPSMLLFVLGRQPFGMHVFAERHLLPSIIAWTLLAGMGLWGIFTNRRLLIGIGAAILCGFQLAPVFQYWRQPHRLPFHQVAAAISQSHLPVYTTWPYGIGSPVNFYLRDGNQVIPLPENGAQLPAEFIVLYRPNAAKERAWLITTTGSAFIQRDDGYFHSAINPEWGTRISRFRRK
ncbi:MAG: hypothetical protein IT168_26840 [Bryobacterales bacterium]|nr:hypothetical protein [Bryobacterales bacterium]